MKTGVYKITNILNGDCYIGSTAKRGFDKRKWEHFGKLKRKTHHSIILQRAYEKYGSGNFVFEIIEECSPEKCIEREQYYLDTLHPKYNVRKIADCNFSVKHTEECKKRMSEMKIGIKNPFYGKTHSDETKKKISSFLIGNQYNKNKKRSEDACRKVSAVLRGRSVSEETRQKLRDANIGDKNPNYGKIASIEAKQRMSFSKSGVKNPRFSGYYRFKNLLSGEEIVNTKFGFSCDYRLDKSSISKICHQKQKSHGGWVCVGKEDSYV